MTVFDLLMLDVVNASSEIPLSSRNLQWKNYFNNASQFSKGKTYKTKFFIMIYNGKNEGVYLFLLMTYF